MTGTIDSEDIQSCQYIALLSQSEEQASLEQ